MRRLTAKSKNGRHPRWKHLILVECDRHYGMWIVTTPALPGKSMLVSSDDLAHMNPDLAEHEYGYVPDDYLECFE